MGAGGFPGQQEALLEVLRERQRLSRRRVFRAAGMAALAGVTCGSLATRWVANRTHVATPVNDHGHLAELRRLAEAPLATLLAQPTTLATGLQTYPQDPVLWQAAIRVLVAADHPAAVAYGAPAAVRAICSTLEPPASLRPLIKDLLDRQ